MADRVEYTMEKMLPDLIMLEKKEVLTRSEIKEIVKKRRDFEYRLQSKSSTDVDFLEAIAYEKTLQKTVKDRLTLKKDELKIASEDYSIVRRITMLYDRFMTKYKNRMDIFKKYLAFLIQEKSYKKLSSVIATYLATDGQNPEAWRIAAYAEYEINGNSETSRKLFLKALALNETDISLWSYYLKFELDFLAKITERQKILKEGEESKKLKLIEGEAAQNAENLKQEKINFSVPKIVIDHAISKLSLLKNKDPKILTKLKEKFEQELNKFNSDILNISEIKEYIKEKF